MTTTAQLLNAYRAYAEAEAAANAQFDIANIFDMPEMPEYTPAAHAGELIHERGIEGALKVAEFSIEQPDTPESARDAYQLIIDACR